MKLSAKFLFCHILCLHFYIQSYCLRFLSNRYMKNGAPINAMIIPAGSSPGEKIVLPTRSEKTTRQAPKKHEQKILSRSPGPAMRRAICGTTSPTKPRSPAKDTAAAHIALARITVVILTVRTDTPSRLAASSPRQRSSSLGAITTAAATHIAVIAAGK